MEVPQPRRGTVSANSIHTSPRVKVSVCPRQPCKRKAERTSTRAQRLEEASETKARDTSKSNGTARKDADGTFPQYESDSNDTDFLPKREPGNFPNVHPNRLQAALSKVKSLTASASVSGSVAAVEEESEYDPLRDGPLRYLGYANEVGEAFAAWLPFWGVPFSYAVAVSYVLTDTADKGNRAFKTSSQELSANQELHPEINVPRLVKLLAFERALDTVVWQLLASVACPGYTIHTIVALTHAILKPLEETAQAQQLADGAAASLHIQAADVLALLDKSFPTMVGLAAIPFIVHPIDNTIHAIMNVSMRPAMRKYVCGSGQGSLAGLRMCDEECVPAQDSPGPSAELSLLQGKNSMAISSQAAFH